MSRDDAHSASSAQNGSEDSDNGQKQERPDGAAIGSGFQERELGKFSDTAIVRRLWVYMRPYKWLFLLCLLLLPAATAVNLVQPFLLQIAIDDYLMAETVDGIWIIIVLFFGAVVAHGVLTYFQQYLMKYAGHQALRDLRLELFEHVQDLASSFFKKTPVGRLMTRMTSDVENLEEALSSGIVTMVGDLITLLAIVVILLSMNWQLALASFIVVPPLIIFTLIIRYFLRKAYRATRTKIARLYAHLQESITGMSIIQLFVRENVSHDEYRDINADYRDANVRAIRWDAILYAVIETVGSITIGAILWYGSGQALQGLVTLGVLVAFVEYMQKFFKPVRNLAEKYNLLQSAMASSERIFDLLDTDEKIAATTDPKPLPERPFTIEFRDVHFGYTDDEMVLEGLSFSINPCERIALVGQTGAGKSTIISLLTRLYDVDKGQILINGRDIRNFDVRQLRRQFAVVLQDVFLFHGTLFENLTLGDDDVTAEEVERAIDMVYADELVSELPGGLQFELAERGDNLSSGEKQLIAFARALILQPELLVLDEATANVDTDTEALIQKAIEELLTHQTSLVIAHRLSTIQRADRILVLDKGNLVEDGSHEELLELGGHYARLYQLQYATTAETGGDDDFTAVDRMQA